ncbi:MAG: SH3 domain-containing protein [Gemmatimonadetes bacterium]|jgi:hypothetical protein|nr:SH3 domain-containing protein [Gemmatimonadota bacterium]MBT4612743.1 SH3 domain-containing protein [Gemmatimonadota bacterium]MBT5055019.1 SH3 domain-containing protein [Gemmatimonadota bacterium]MBT5143352.1 SH3 domain-containing protein [Gemmatimonadota bacterium]MBT5586714.1 SH3 domain-containing protein [Gemmatimonadota bacterium]
MERGKVKPTEGLNLRVKPNGDKIGVLSHDQEFTILEEVRFLRIKLDDGSVGYVHGDFVQRIPDADELSAPVLPVDDFRPRFKSVVFHHECFVGETVRVDEDFVPHLEKLASFAQARGLKIWATSSLRNLENQIRGAIVRPASKSCHHVGHAIDLNLMDGTDFYNSKQLRKGNHAELPESVLGFIEDIRTDPVMRWGGDFSEEDPVHVDDDLYHTQELLYSAKLESRVQQLNV